jgi:hypothetical protein
MLLVKSGRKVALAFTEALRLEDLYGVEVELHIFLTSSLEGGS